MGPVDTPRTPAEDGPQSDDGALLLDTGQVIILIIGEQINKLIDISQSFIICFFTTRQKVLKVATKSKSEMMTTVD